MFPGQGSQHPCMLRELPDHPAVRETLAEANGVLGREVLELSTSEALTSTVTVQLALLVSGTATARALAAEEGRPDFVAGHSVGAFAAAVVAGALTFSDALRLVDLRAHAMRAAYPEGYAMGVVVGLDERTVSQLVAKVDRLEAPIHTANVNAPLQVSVSGADDALEQLFDLARRKGARHAGYLAVSIPSHTPLLAPVAAELSQALANVSLHPPTIPYISNVGGRALRDPDAVREDLTRSVECPVRWHDATTLLYELGVRLFVEVPPGNVLTRLAANAFPDARCVSIDESDLESALLLIRRTQNRTR